MSNSTQNNETHAHESNEEETSEKPQTDGKRPMANLAFLSRSPGAKFIIIGVITVLLLIPALLVWGLVEERAFRAQTVASSISQGWGNNQTVNGPYLVVPYSVEEEIAGEGRVKLTRTVSRYAIFSAQESQLNADVQVHERRKSIYSVPLYHMKSTLSGKFGAVDLSQITGIGGEPKADKAFLAISVSDPAGFRSRVMAKIGTSGAEPFQPGLSGIGGPPVNVVSRGTGRAIPTVNTGIHRPVTRAQLMSGFSYEIDLALNGSRDLAIVPNSGNTSVNLASNWPHPGFDGRFLPETRDVADDGFTASWTVPNLARGVDAVLFQRQLPVSASNIKVNFVEPLQFYQVVSRTLKYAIAFFALTFLAVFILELNGVRSIHWIQYVLVGLAMVVFYILLLALAEHVGFTIAYLVSASATTALIAWYVGDALGRRNSGLVLAGVMAFIYGVVFLVLKEDEYALLAGSIIAFVAIAITMGLTRNVNWSAGSPLPPQTEGARA